MLITIAALTVAVKQYQVKPGHQYWRIECPHVNLMRVVEFDAEV